MEGETSTDEVSKGNEASVKRCCATYKECRRNHAASFGRYAVDGCGEFICCDDDVFICAACGCHRSFHRKDNTNSPSLLMPVPPPPDHRVPYLAPMPLASHNGLTGETSLFFKDRRNDIDVPESETPAEVEEEKDVKKRAKRTILTLEQKSKMVSFADKLGWRSQRQNDAEIQQFCKEIGITKRVFVVWLNNNRRRKDSM